jgi:hypothetical protein
MADLDLQDLRDGMPEGQDDEMQDDVDVIDKEKKLTVRRY